jgi:hypothetical protein
LIAIGKPPVDTVTILDTELCQLECDYTEATEWRSIGSRDDSTRGFLLCVYCRIPLQSPYFGYVKHTKEPVEVITWLSLEVTQVMFTDVRKESFEVLPITKQLRSTRGNSFILLHFLRKSKMDKLTAQQTLVIRGDCVPEN